MIKANHQMLRVLFDLHVGKGHQLSSRLKQVLAAGIVEEDGCWFLAKRRAGTKGKISDFGDRTGLECFVNKVHIEEQSPINIQEQGLLFVSAIRELLEPHGHFNIMMEVSNSDIEGKPNILTCNVRFHKIRTGEQWLKDDLDAYRDEGILLLTTGSAVNNTKH